MGAVVNQRSKTQVAITFWVDRDLKSALKALAAERSETVTDVLLRAVRQYVGS